MTNTFVTNQFSSNHVAIGGATYLFFSGTAYLGLNHHEGFCRHIIEGMSRYGASYGSSRNTNLQLSVYREAEEALAVFAGAPSAITVSSGFTAGQLVVNTFRNTHHFFVAPDAHPAVCPGSGEVYTYTVSEWTNTIADQVNASGYRDVAIVCNAIDPLFCSAPGFGWVNDLSACKQVLLVVDDSHGLGVTGENGNGIYNSIPRVDNVRLLVVASLNKAMGLPGGVVFGDSATTALLQTTAAFRTASPIAPAFLYAFTRAADIYRDALKKLRQNIKLFLSQYDAKPVFRHLADYPVFYTPEEALAGYLNQHKIILSSFRYPRADSNILNRIVINAHHEASDINRLAAVLKAYAGSSR